MSDTLRRTVHKGTTKIERHHKKLAEHLAFGGNGLFRTNDPAEQEKAIVYNELVANAVALQTVVDQTQALHTLNSAGVRIGRADLAFLSPYPTSKLKRFGDYPPHPIPEPMPATTTLPMECFPRMAYGRFLHESYRRPMWVCSSRRKWETCSPSAHAR